MSDFTQDEQLIADAVREARHIQEFIWDDASLSRLPFDSAVWAAVFQKRVDDIADIDTSKSTAMVMLRKRLLQQAALSIKALVVLSTYGVKNNQ